MCGYVLYYHKKDSDEENGYEVDGNVVAAAVVFALGENNISGTAVAKDL